MKRAWIAAAIAAVLIAGAVAVSIVRRPAKPPAAGPSPEEAIQAPGASEAALAKLRSIPFYRAMLNGPALRSASLERDGALRVRVDVRTLVEPRAAALGLAGVTDMLPRQATGTIDPDGRHESWLFEGPCPLFDVLDRKAAAAGTAPSLDAIPGTPSALIHLRLLPSRLTDPALGGNVFATWRDRAGFAEKLLGRPLRAEIAEDLAGPVTLALFEGPDPASTEAIVVVELRRSDRLSGLLDMLFGLGALAERGSVRRYRGVATGSFFSKSGAPGVALAVDGPMLFAATSRALLESAIDARRAPPQRNGSLANDLDLAASWSAVSRSTFVARGWRRLARLPDEPESGAPQTSSALWPEGTSAWRLVGNGPAPAITADPMLPFLRTAMRGLRDREP